VVGTRQVTKKVFSDTAFPQRLKAAYFLADYGTSGTRALPKGA